MKVLWAIMRVTLACLCMAGGAYKVFKVEELSLMVAAMRALPHAMWHLFGAIECLAGLALVAPNLSRFFPPARAAAASVVLVLQILISAIYVCYGDWSPLPFTLAMGSMAAAIRCGRSSLQSGA